MTTVARRIVNDVSYVTRSIVSVTLQVAQSSTGVIVCSTE